MSDALATGLIGLGGVALGLAGTAVIQWVTRTASRRDAAQERQGAVLRELQDVLAEFGREWVGFINAVGEGKAHISTLPYDSKPVKLLSRLTVLSHRVTDPLIRHDTHEIHDLAVMLAGKADGDGISLARRIDDAQDRMGAVLRRIS